MKIRDLIQQLRWLVHEHPHAADLDVELAPHGLAHRQAIEQVKLNTHGTVIVLEAEK